MRAQRIPYPVEPQLRDRQRESTVGSAEQALDPRDRPLMLTEFRFNSGEVLLGDRAKDRIFGGWQSRHPAFCFAERSLFIA